MKPFDLTRKARTDLRAIAIFTEEQWGVEQRNLYIKQFDDTFRMLAASPMVGKNCDEVMPGYRKFPHGSHVVFYKEAATASLKLFVSCTKAWMLRCRFTAHDTFESGAFDGM